LKPLLSFGGQYDFQGMIRLASRAMESGFWGVAFSEDLESCGPDPFLSIATLSQKCPGLAFMTNVINQFSRHPVSLASSALSCSDLLGDRFILGLGPGSPSTSLALGLSSNGRPLEMLKEVVEIVRKITRAGINSISYSGKFFKIKSIESVRQREYALKIFMPAIQDKALGFVAKYADGIAYSNFSSLSYIKHARKIMAAVRPLDGFEASCNLTFIPTSNLDEGIKKFARPYAERYLSFPGIGEALLGRSGYDPSICSDIRKGNFDRLTNEMIESMAVIGSRDKLMDRLASMEKLGVEYPIIATDPAYLNDLFSEPIV
jgi:alkanesulfonate monooxygenase SsuD/methylene tetrahydromethanopterin reductase-like flavin-dependent oxidoreductase (luciferase family)